MVLKRSIQQAVKVKCIDCIYDPKAGGTHLAQTENCKAVDCPLWEHRPLTEATKAQLRQEAYSRMTPEQQHKADVLAEQRRERLKRLHKARTPSPQPV